MIQPSIFRELKILIKYLFKESVHSCHDGEACSRVRHECVQFKRPRQFKRHNRIK